MLQQLQLPRSGPSGQPIESSQPACFQSPFGAPPDVSPIPVHRFPVHRFPAPRTAWLAHAAGGDRRRLPRSEEHTSELQSLMRISYAVFCLKKKKNNITIFTNTKQQNNTTTSDTLQY